MAEWLAADSVLPARRGAFNKALRNIFAVCDEVATKRVDGEISIEGITIDRLGKGSSVMLCYVLVIWFEGCVYQKGVEISVVGVEV